MVTNTAYRIENLDVYRKSIALGTRLYQAAGNGKAHSAVGERVRENTLALVLNLAWARLLGEAVEDEPLRASKRCDGMRRCSRMVALGEMKAKPRPSTPRLQELARMIGACCASRSAARAAATRGRRPRAAARAPPLPLGGAARGAGVVSFEKARFTRAGRFTSPSAAAPGRRCPHGEEKSSASV
jgi:hypothetical protein